MTAGSNDATALFAALLIGTLLCLGWVNSRPAEGSPTDEHELPIELQAPPAWPDALVDSVSGIAVQVDGRVKPLGTWARYTLLRLNHRAGVKDAWGRSQEPVAWVLDALLRPEVAKRCPCFLVPDDEVLQAVGLDRGSDKKKRDRYTYLDLAPARAAILSQGTNFAHMPAERRSRVQTFIMDLSHELTVFEQLTSYLDFARSEDQLIALAGPVQELFAGRKAVAPDTLLAGVADLLRMPAHPSVGSALTRLVERFRSAEALALIPPADPTEERWLTPFELASAAAMGRPPSEGQLQLIGALTTAARSSDLEITRGAFADFASSSRAQAKRAYEKIDLEVDLARLDPFTRALWLYLGAFLLLAVSWLAPNRWLIRGAWALVMAGLGVLVVGIVIRCVLRDRPPVSTLYETVLFITAVMVAACLVLERIDKRRVALAAAPILGAIGMFMAHRYEVLKGEDTMPQLVAVLDTNFWLTVHVLCISIGYAGGLLASALAHVHIFSRVFGGSRAQGSFDRSVARMVYGTLCFALVFSVVGTILGGIWANESWGRFWGWDPKENGALMIVLAQLAILHGRLGGMLRAFGISMATIFQGIVVGFSWWGVNLLGIGLHSYGHTSGVASALNTFYAVEVGVLLLGGLGWVRGRTRRSS